MSDPIRLAIIGTGLIVTARHWPALRQRTRDFQVVALANRTPEKAEKLADAIRSIRRTRPSVYTDYREMLAREKPDAVSLALPTVINPEVAQACLAAGCHVIAEKPIAASLAEGATMLPWPAYYNRVLMIAENFRYLSSYQRAAALIAEDMIGRPGTARWSLYAYLGPENPYYHTPWRQQPAHPGGYLSDSGVHHAAALRLLLGEVETVSAQVAALRPDLPPADTLSATLRFASGAVGAYAATYAMAGPESPLQVAGPGGTLLISRDRIELWRKGQSGCRGQPARYWEEPSPEDGLVAMYGDFAEAIRTGRPPRSTPAEALADLRLIVAMLRAAEKGHVVTVKDVV